MSACVMKPLDCNKLSHALLPTVPAEGVQFVWVIGDDNHAAVDQDSQAANTSCRAGVDKWMVGLACVEVSRHSGREADSRLDHVTVTNIPLTAVPRHWSWGTLLMSASRM